MDRILDLDDDVRLGKQMLLYAPLCSVMQAILEVVYRTCRNHSTWQTVPNLHNALTVRLLLTAILNWWPRRL